ncbi:MAG: type II secretion system F family protein, partial [Rhodothalassiaceae bacterium]
MPRFVFRALNGAGEIVEGERESPDRGALVAALKAEGLRPLKAQRKGHGLRLKLDFGSGRRVDEAALALFTRGVATLLGAGLPLEQALAEAAEGESVPAMRETVRAVLAGVRGGASLADALAGHGDVFPPYYVGLVRAGEAGGTLAEVMRDLADAVERARGLKQDIRSALLYPLLVLVTAVGSLLILLLAVIPEFEPLFEGAGDSLPVTAVAVMWLSRVLRADGWLLLLLLLLAAVGLRASWRDARLRRAIDARLLHMPLVGPVLAKTETARFARSLGTLLRNGVDLVPALSMAARTLANAVLVQGIEGIIPRVRRGEGVSGPLAAAGVLPPMAERLVRVGESSGALATMLLTVARIHEEEVAREIKRLVAL